MKIGITKDEYRALLEIFSMAEWVMHVHGSEEDERKKPYDEVIERFYSYAKEMGMDNLILYDPELGKYYPTVEFEDNSEAGIFIEEFEDDSFWDELMNRLTERDLIEEIGNEEDFHKMDAMKRIRLQETVREKYMNEFAANGIKNICVKSKGKIDNQRQTLLRFNRRALALQGENLKLREQIRGLEGKLAIKENIIWESPVYWLRIETGKDGPYCQRCWDVDGKLVRLQEYGQGDWVCTNCGKGFMSKGLIDKLNKDWGE